MNLEGLYIVVLPTTGTLTINLNSIIMNLEDDQIYPVKTHWISLTRLNIAYRV